MPVKNRLLYLVISWLTAGLVYAGAGAVQGNAWIVPESAVERLLPFSPQGIWLYLLFYVYIPYTFVTADAAKIRPMTVAFVLASCISGVFFLLLPSTVRFPAFEPYGISAGLLDFVGRHDTPQNCFPSMHASLITICTLVNLNASRKIRSYACILLTLLMYCAIIQVRRHVFIDLAAGIVLAFLVWGFSLWFSARRNRPKNEPF